jgi:hypothetical protein
LSLSTDPKEAPFSIYECKDGRPSGCHVRDALAANLPPLPACFYRALLPSNQKEENAMNRYLAAGLGSPNAVALACRADVAWRIDLLRRP